MSIKSLYRFLFFLPLSLLLLPFVVIPGMYNPYEFPKFIFLLIGIQLFIIARTAFCLTSKKPLFCFDKLSFLVILFLVPLFLANVLGLDPRISFLGSMYRHQGFLLWLSLGLFFLLLYALRPAEKKTLFHRFAQYAPYALVLLCCIAIIHGVRFFIFHDYSVPMLNGRIVTTFGNPNFLAGYAVMLLPIAFFGTTLFKKVSKRTRIGFQTLLMILSITTILLTDSKSALLALIAITLLFIYKHRTRFVIPGLTRNLITTISCVVVIFALFLLFQTSRLSPWDNRSIIWSYGIQSITKHPLLGIGQENYELIVDPARHIPIDNAHNIFLELAVAGGIPVLLIFCSILFLGFKRSPYPIRLSIIAFLICACFNPLSIPQLATFWFLLALSHL